MTCVACHEGENLSPFIKFMDEMIALYGKGVHPKYRVAKEWRAHAQHWEICRQCQAEWAETYWNERFTLEIERGVTYGSKE